MRQIEEVGGDGGGQRAARGEGGGGRGRRVDDAVRGEDGKQGGAASGGDHKKIRECAVASASQYDHF